MSQAAATRATAKSVVAHRILILDFGSQYTQLIARRVREAGVYIDTPPRADPAVFDLAVPVLGICYGMQTMAAQLGGEVEPSNHREFGYALVRPGEGSRLLDALQDEESADGERLLNVWMSHGDRVGSLPPGFTAIASTDNAPLAGMADEDRRLYGLQFHPEVTHTPQGQRIIERFVQDICACPDTWRPGNIVARDVELIREQVGDDGVLLGLSGGVDSSVVAALLHAALGEIHVLA